MNGGTIQEGCEGGDERCEDGHGVCTGVVGGFCFCKSGIEEIIVIALLISRSILDKKDTF